MPSGVAVWFSIRSPACRHRTSRPSRSRAPITGVVAISTGGRPAGTGRSAVPAPPQLNPAISMISCPSRSAIPSPPPRWSGRHRAGSRRAKAAYAQHVERLHFAPVDLREQKALRQSGRRRSARNNKVCPPRRSPRDAQSQPVYMFGADVGATISCSCCPPLHIPVTGERLTALQSACRAAACS